ncbi:hypothetical protein [Victivallis vadensis]|uniref:hypothetical protein n=1 Tax=Victivallis vadensis TaxID=172901 RepID=UPI0026DBADB0|nr:hypothetical protein [Victivallis vadensis]
MQNRFEMGAWFYSSVEYTSPCRQSRQQLVDGLHFFVSKDSVTPAQIGWGTGVFRPRVRIIVRDAGFPQDFQNKFCSGHPGNVFGVSSFKLRGYTSRYHHGEKSSKLI